MNTNTNNTNATNNTKAYTEKEIKTALFMGYTKVYDQLFNKAIELYSGWKLETTLKELIEMLIKTLALRELRRDYYGSHDYTNWNVDSSELVRMIRIVSSFESVKRFKRIYKTVTGNRFSMCNNEYDNCWSEIYTAYNAYKNNDDPFKNMWYNVYYNTFVLSRNWNIER